MVEFLGPGDLLGPIGQVLDGSRHPPAHDPPQQGGGRRRQEPDRDQPVSHTGQRVVGLGQTPGDLGHDPVGEGCGHHAVAPAVELDVFEHRIARPSHPGDGLGVDRERIGSLEREHHTGVGSDELGDGVGLGERQPAEDGPGVAPAGPARSSKKPSRADTWKLSVRARRKSSISPRNSVCVDR